jgi:recombination protein RecA
MARKKKVVEETKADLDDFASDLIKSLNKEQGNRVAYNLSCDDSPTHVKRWVSTGSRLLDYICANRRNGGLPEGRIVEIFGPPSIGKSHIATQIAASTQKMGGIVVYIDTENATSVENLAMLGVDVSKRFVYVDTHCTEDVFQVTESTILKAQAMNKDVPITIIWDSVAATSPKAELDGDYDKNSIGLNARAISKGMRKITGVIGQTNTLMVCLNQTRTKIGVMYGDPTTTPGGAAIPFHSSIRLKLGAGQQIKEGDDVVGINVSAKTIKNKVAAPFRTVKFQIHFGKGIKEHEEIFDILRKHGPETIDGKIVEVSGSGAWKNYSLANEETGEVIDEKKFHKAKFDELLADPQYSVHIDNLLEKAMVKILNDVEELDINIESYEEMKAVALEIEDTSDGYNDLI